MRVNKFNSTKDNPSLTTCLLNWQTAGDEASFDALYRAALPIVTGVAERRLRKAGIRDGSACDEVVSRVFLHIVRLNDEKAKLTRFDEKRVDRGLGDPAEAYLRWLAANRSLDLIRASRLMQRDMEPLCSDVPQPAESSSETGQWPWEASISGLDERSQQVVRLLLSGLSQKQIAETIGTCEGTVSRIRAKAIETMRQAASSERGCEEPSRRKPKAK